MNSWFCLTSLRLVGCRVVLCVVGSKWVVEMEYPEQSEREASSAQELLMNRLPPPLILLPVALMRLKR